MQMILNEQSQEMFNHSCIKFVEKFCLRTENGIRMMAYFDIDLNLQEKLIEIIEESAKKQVDQFIDHVISLSQGHHRPNQIKQQ